MKKDVSSHYKSKHFLYIALLGVVFLVLSVTAIPVAYGDFDEFWDLFTGAASTATTSVSVTINALPQITFVRTENSSPITVSESLTQVVNISFVATDADGVGTLNNASAAVQINFTATQPTNVDTRFNYSCAANATVGATLNSVNYTCVVYIWYFDAAGAWTINASVKDNNGAYGENRTNMFLLASLTAMVMSPSTLSWPVLESGTTNRTSNNDPLTINNTGNDNIDVGGFSVTGVDLRGQTAGSTDFFRVQNFSVHAVNGTDGCTAENCRECNGSQLLNSTSGTANPQVLGMANMSRGNNTINYQNTTSGQENLFFCIRLVPSELPRAVYNTTGGNGTGVWTVTIS